MVPFAAIATINNLPAKIASTRCNVTEAVTLAVLYNYIIVLIYVDNNI